MKMSAIATAIAGAAASGTSRARLLASSPAMPSLRSSRVLANAKSTAGVAKRTRVASVPCRVRNEGRRRGGLAFASAPPPEASASSAMLPWPSACHSRRRLSSGDGQPTKLPWTPIRETKLRMTTAPSTEGFRDAMRGGQHYLQPRGVAKDGDERWEDGDAAVPPARPLQGPSQPPPQPTPRTETPSRGIPFPKLTPGRRRNYRPPHVAAALRANAEMSGAVPSPVRVEERENRLEAPNPDDHIENFRDGREGAQRVRVRGGLGSAVAAEDSAPSQSSRSTDVGPGVAVSWETTEEELLRDGPRSAAARSGSRSGSSSGSDAVDETSDEPSRSGVVSATDSGSGGRTPPPLSPTHRATRDSRGPSSMNFRDGTRMATFKDAAFKDDALLVNAESTGIELGDLLEEAGRDNADEENDDDSIHSSLVGTDGEDRMSIESMYQSIIDNAASANPPGAAEQRVRTTTMAASADSVPSSRPPLLSIDPKSIDIIPLSTGKAMEEKDEPVEDDEDAGFRNSGHRRSRAPLNDPVRSHNWAGLADTGSFVKMFRGSASYIANHRGTVMVCHIPGELLAWEGFPGLMDDIALTWLLGMKIVLVAGCRHQIDLRLEDMDGEEEYGGEGSSSLGGRVLMSSIRVTDEDTLRVVKEEAGFVRFEVERRLAKSLRLHGGLVKGSERLIGNVVSGNFYSAQPFGVVDGIDYCWTGFPRKVEVERIRQVHETNDIVLLTSLGVSPSGEIFNVNSEFLAATVAGSIGASKIIYFNVHGTSFQHKMTEKPVQNLRVSDAKNLLAHYKMRIHPKGFALVDLDGDLPQQSVTLRTPGSMETLIKVGYSMVALEHGVKRAHILAPENGALVQELYTRDGCGTLISRDIYDGIRRGDVNDVSGIYDLCSPLVRSGILVERPKSELEKDILSYYVYTRDELIVATGQLKRFEGGFAEIGCLIVSKDYRKGGRGDAMLGYLVRLAHQSGAKKVFVLSTQTMEWFVERGFREVTVESLPPSRQAVYNKKRNSKIYMKEIEDDRDLDAAELWWSNK